jgi:hypothetical protein
MDEQKFPSRILALAEQSKGQPLDFHEYEDRIVIVFVDGRKQTFWKDRNSGETEVTVKHAEISAHTEAAPKKGKRK